jgi:hypothetical protein
MSKYEYLYNDTRLHCAFVPTDHLLVSDGYSSLIFEVVEEEEEITSMAIYLNQERVRELRNLLDAWLVKHGR